MTIWAFACPTCRQALAGTTQTLSCSACGERYERCEDIWRFLPAPRRDLYDRFLHEYRTVRADEGWGRPDPEYYRRLPFVSPDDPQRAIWEIRARTFLTLIEQIVAPVEEARPGAMTILDVGAGNCWLAFRLSHRGHRIAAVDLSDDATDGLGAHVHYEPAGDVALVQAEFDRLPFVGEQADLIIFNGSIHYSTNYATTLGEAARVLRPDGQVVIVDSPVYRSTASGRRMVREREQDYAGRYGFPSNALSVEGFVTLDRLREAGAVTGLAWTIIEPPMGLRFTALRWKARFVRAREPARFPILIGSRVRRQSTQ